MNVAKDMDALPALEDYAPPDAPTLDVLQRLRERLGRTFARGREPAVRDDRLSRAARATVEDYVAVPDCSVVTAELGAAVDEWLVDETPNARILLVVMPPCETRGLVERLARERGFECLEEPGRDAITAPGGVPEAPFDAGSDRVLAVPRLERWFVRHRHGLGLARSLLGALADTDRRCLVAVNSWGWRFVAAAARADLVLPAPVTVNPFGAARLREWLVELAEADGTADVTVRSMDDDEDVLATDGAGAPTSEFLAELASRAHGIPWVAWQLWRRGLRTLPVEDDDAEARAGAERELEARDAGADGGGGSDGVDGGAGCGSSASNVSEGERAERVDPAGNDATPPSPSAVAEDPRTESGRFEGAPKARHGAEGDDHTLWIVHEAPLALPAGHEHDACLVLQSLLIHAFLEPAELQGTVPIVGQSGIVRALERAGFIERGEGGFRCRPAAYPSIRTALDDAGYPLPPV